MNERCLVPRRVARTKSLRTDRLQLGRAIGLDSDSAFKELLECSYVLADESLSLRRLAEFVIENGFHEGRADSQRSAGRQVQMLTQKFRQSCPSNVAAQ